MTKKIAYFTAEVGLNNQIKTYSGGLGILAGDTIKAMADLKVPFCAVTLLYKYGFFKQKIINNYQNEEDDNWDFQKYLIPHDKYVIINIQGEDIQVKIWEYNYIGNTGHKVPIYFLDTDLDINPLWAQDITKRLYQGDRLHQEMVLGIGGIKALQNLGHNKIKKYHMNEGHSAFLTLELYKQFGDQLGWDENFVKEKCVFTTHTPIPAGHDKFEYEDIYKNFNDKTRLIPWHIKKLAGQNRLNTTKLAMSFSNHINAVSKKHCEVTKKMFPEYNIYYITNGIHSASWASEHIQKIFNNHIPDWKNDFSKLKHVTKISNEEILLAHQKSKIELIDFINENNITGVKLKPEILTIGFARRFIEYKEADFIFKNMEDLKELGQKVQFVFAGKSHKDDGIGKSIMKKVIEYSKELKDDISIAFLENYNIDTAKKLISGCDLWLNVPIPYNEASGTSGMKAAVNGCIHFSRLDGWAIESFEMNGQGYPIYQYEDFIQTLKYNIIPKFYENYNDLWAMEMKLTIANAGSYFNTHRMAKEYCKLAYKIDLDEN